MEVLEKEGEHHRVFPARDADADFIIRLQKLINRQSFREFPIDLVLKSGVERALDLLGSRQGLFPLLFFHEEKSSMQNAKTKKKKAYNKRDES